MLLGNDSQHEANVRWAARNEALSRCAESSVLFRLYRVRAFRRPIIRLLKSREGDEFFSQTLRDVFAHYHGVKIGNYTYGCFVPDSLPAGTLIGNYCSIAPRLTVLRRNHPYLRLSQHPFFYNHRLGLVSADTIDLSLDNPLTIGNDVWIGEGVMVVPGCRRIGDGAIVAAGAILTHDVEPFSIVAGNPGRKIRDRYRDELKAELEALEWWKTPITELLEQDFPFEQEVTLDLISRLKTARDNGAV
jgi:acetyltransferase-like isoleucine patch superfamily enzyme